MNYGESQEKMQKEKKAQVKNQTSTQIRASSKVFTELEEFRVESWSRQDVQELAQEMNWNFNQKGNYHAEL